MAFGVCCAAGYSAPVLMTMPQRLAWSRIWPDIGSMDASPAIESPCVLICVMDPRTGYCFGCGRTRDEIASWISYAPEDRRAIMDTLPGRLATVERPPRRETRRRQMERERGGGS